MTKSEPHPREFRDLTATLASVTDAREMHDFLYALLSPVERSRLALRWNLVKLLENGVSQRTIVAKLGISLCKITRGSRELKSGPKGFRSVVRRAVTRKK